MSSNKVLIVYEGPTIYAIVATVTGSDIVFGTAVSSGQLANDMYSCALSTDKALVVYDNQT